MAAVFRLTVRNLMRRSILSIVAIVTLIGQAGAQAQERILSVAVRGTYTTSSKVFYNPDSPFSDLRGQYTGLDNIYGEGIELRLNIPRYSFGLSLAAEYLLKLEQQTELVGFTNPPRPLTVQEGFRVIPIELGAFVYIPLGSEQVRLAMGGGVGAYIGKRYLTVAGIDALQQNESISYGIHVETSFDYQIFPRVYARLDMRFRDPEFTATSRFTQQATEQGGVLIELPRAPFRAKINVNGLNFGLGLGVDIL
jgi:hypothetical protein